MFLRKSQNPGKTLLAHEPVESNSHSLQEESPKWGQFVVTAQIRGENSGETLEHWVSEVRCGSVSRWGTEVGAFTYLSSHRALSAVMEQEPPRSL